MINVISRRSRRTVTNSGIACTLSCRFIATLGIRREDPGRIWERRAPLTPHAVAQLVDGSLQTKAIVEVESCKRRCFTDEAYAAAGARIVPRLSASVDVVLGIKEPRVDAVHQLIASAPAHKRTWMMFSHTHKGQKYNIPLLSAFLRPIQDETLIDHELLTAPSPDGNLKRVAAFGWYAGAVGAGEALSLTGLALLKRGMAHPLLHLPRPYTFPSLAAFKTALNATGKSLASAQPISDGPIVIGLTGAGNVSAGARDMLDALGVEWVDPSRLPNLPNNSKIFACAIPPSEYFERKNGGGYDRAEYYSTPDLYHSTFTKKIAPYLTVLIHAAGWQTGFPRIIANTDIEALINEAVGPQKLSVVQDISCDLKGALEFMDQHTTIDKPSFEGPGGILIGSTDILPTELPADASTHFSTKLLPYVSRALMYAYNETTSNEDEIDRTLSRAQIVNNGVLQGKHKWLESSVEQWRSEQNFTDSVADSTLRPQRKRILLLGSGLVAGPAVDVFVARPDVTLVIASNNLLEAETLAGGRNNVSVKLLDVSDEIALGEAVAAADVVVSLLPAPMHPQVARHCIKHGRHLVTASYVSPEMKSLDDDAQARGVLLLGECGLDPGIDSMAAMRILERVKREGKRVTSFVSWCGGLPEPVASNVPLGYKFSWSPKAVLTAALNDARFKLNGKIQTIPGPQLLAQHFPSVPLWKGLALEGIANRDSLPYAQKYGLGELDGLRDVFRGTLRYQGFSDLLDSFRRIGLLATDSIAIPINSWESLLLACVEQTLGAKVENADISQAVKDIVGNRGDETLDALKWLALLPSQENMPSLTAPPAGVAPIDLFAGLLSQKLAYEPHERDTALLHHSFRLIPVNSASAGVSEESVTASLLCTGTSRASAMSTTVGCTLAFSALRVADGKVAARGVHGPYERDVWEGVLAELESIGIKVKETWS